MLSLYILILLAVVFDFLNGVRDAGNFVSTLISTRALSRTTALIIAAAAEFCGPLIFGTAVAATFGKGLIAPGQLTLKVMLAAQIAAILWNLITLWLSTPSSSTHALVGGIVGAALFASGTSALQMRGLEKILLSLFLSPTLGILAGYVIMQVVLFLSRSATPRVNTLFQRLQIPAAMMQALSYGANDAQKTMAVITLGLLAAGQLDAFEVPVWVMLLSAGAIAAGILFSSQRVVRTLGSKFYRLKPIHGFAAQTGSAVVLAGASLLGYPASSSQVITSSILGAGTAERINMVRWGIAWQIVQAWFIAIPVNMALAAGTYWVLDRIMFFN